MNIDVEYVHYMPRQLMQGVLYVSRQFKTAAHLCACGCGSKVRTPLTPTEWQLVVSKLGPSLYPSIGNWQLACRSHYWIKEGEIIWSDQWTDEQIAKGRRSEDAQRQAYYQHEPSCHVRLFEKVWEWIRKFFVG